MLTRLNISSQIIDKIKLLSITAGAQILVQAISFICGILVIRLLPTNEYALYTLANTMLGSMALLADGGIASGVMAQGGKAWKSKAQLGAVLATGIELRRKFALISIILGTPALIYLLQKHDASWLMTILITVSIFPPFLLALSGTLLEIVPKLHQDIVGLQKIQVATNVIRLACLSLSLFTYPIAAVALACGGVGQLWNNIRVRKISHRYADNAQPADPKVRAELLLIVRRVMPSAIYYCISAQITIWLISMFGSTEAVAQIGALGRLAMALNVITVVLSSVVVPRFARLPENHSTLKIRFLQIELILILFSSALVYFIWLFPELALWVLGDKYSGLNFEVTLMAASSCMTLIYGTAFSLCAQRGYVVRPSINIGLTLLSQVLLIYFVGYSSVREILMYSIFNGVIQFLIWTSFFLFLMSKKAREITPK